MNAKQCIETITNYYRDDFTVLIGDYPYCACYSSDAHTEGLWLDHWFSTDKYNFVIYIPESLSIDEQLWGLCHEMGHYMNRHNKYPTAKEECRAWDYAERIMDRLGYEIPDEYYEFKIRNLSTYA